jgi:Tol biopolymer transport system component
MGEVYRARDTRLGREVAVKVLPASLTASEQARQRFEREARTISQLSHPHICALYDVGREGETEYLVMELIEGQTLSDRLGKGPLPIDQSLRFGAEIADALEKAHRQGIVHRDLKPANVMLTTSGVKLLDFGLARAIAPSPSAESLTALPTETPLTEAGMVLGTVQYMAPEQLEGKDADARTDIFALGLVLYEMATGRKAFSGATRASLIGAILRDDPPPISREQPLVPRALDRVVATCLAKEPEERWQTARDVALQLEGIRQERSAAEPAAVAPARRRRSAILPWAIAAAAVALALFGLSSGLRQKQARPVLRALMLPPPRTSFHITGANVGGVAVSPNGRRLAFGARDEDGTPQLWIRELDDLEAYAVPGGEGVLFPFWSPDSRSVGFFAKGRLKVVEASASPPPARELADIEEARGASWGEDGTIVYSPQNFGGLMKVPSAGGAPAEATRLNASSGEMAHRWPCFLPGGRRFLYATRRVDPKAPLQVSYTIEAASLDGHERHTVLADGSNPIFVPPGHLLYLRSKDLMAVAFDPASLAVKGEPVQVVKDFQAYAASGHAIVSASENLLAYSPRARAAVASLAWIDRSGKQVGTVGQPGATMHLGLSPDGKAVAVAQLADPLPPDIWLLDTGVGREIRLTRDARAQIGPAFSSDGRRIFFSENLSGPWDIVEMPAQAGSTSKPFLQSPTTKTVNDLSPDGRFLLYREVTARTKGDLKYVELAGDPRPRTFVATVDEETNGDFSPDSRWVAYASDESGRMEIYVASFPDPSRRFRVSSEGGTQPRWSRDGKELYYLHAGKLWSAAVAPKGDDLAFADSKALFPLRLFSTVDPGFDLITRYDVGPDGRFLALLRVGDETPTPLVLVLNWAEALKKP